MKFSTSKSLDPGLHAKMLVPGNAFKKRVHKTNDDRCCNQLRVKTRAFCDTSRNNGRNGSGKGQ